MKVRSDSRNRELQRKVYSPHLIGDDGQRKSDGDWKTFWNESDGDGDQLGTKSEESKRFE